MHYLWQDLVVIGLIAAATGYIVLRLVRLVRGKSRPGCRTCRAAREPTAGSN